MEGDRGSASRGEGHTREILLYTANKRAVRILLECILVVKIFFSQQFMELGYLDLSTMEGFRQTTFLNLALASLILQCKLGNWESFFISSAENLHGAVQQYHMNKIMGWFRNGENRVVRQMELDVKYNQSRNFHSTSRMNCHHK